MKRIPPRLWIALVVVAALLVAARTLPLREWAVAFAEWMRGAGLQGAAAFVAAYVVATVAFLPGLLLTLLAGWVYGPFVGVAVVSPASVAGACAAFLLGRTVARAWIAAKVESSPRFGAIDRAVGEHGFKIVFLLRLSPVFPFNLLNYALGLTRVRFRDYAVASAIGMLPGTFLYVYLGSLVTSAGELLGGGERTRSPAEYALLGVGLLATVAVTFFVTRVARRALASAVKPS